MSRLEKCIRMLRSSAQFVGTSTATKDFGMQSLMLMKPKAHKSTISSLWLTSTLASARYSSASQASTAATRQSQSILSRLMGSRFSTAAGLQVHSFWGKHALKAYALIGLAATYLLWKGTFRLASVFVNLTESMAEWGLLGLAATIVAMIGLYTRSYYSINPLSVYRQTMATLHTNPAVLEILGAPLAGSEVRVMVQSGGGFTISKALKPKIKSPRVQMLFKVSGSDRHGLVSLEVKKKKGKHVFKLLAVDVQPTVSFGANQSVVLDRDGAARVYVFGDREKYNRGGLLWEMRQPYLNALSLQSSFELEDEVDDELDKIKIPKSLPPPSADVQPEEPKEAVKAKVEETPAEPVTEKKSTWRRYLFGGSS